MFIIAYIGKAWNGIGMDKMHLFKRGDRRPVVPEMTRAELEQESKRLSELQAKKRR